MTYQLIKSETLRTHERSESNSQINDSNASREALLQLGTYDSTRRAHEVSQATNLFVQTGELPKVSIDFGLDPNATNYEAAKQSTSSLPEHHFNLSFKGTQDAVVAEQQSVLRQSAFLRSTLDRNQPADQVRENSGQNAEQTDAKTSSHHHKKHKNHGHRAGEQVPIASGSGTVDADGSISYTIGTWSPDNNETPTALTDSVLKYWGVPGPYDQTQRDRVTSVLNAANPGLNMDGDYIPAGMTIVIPAAPPEGENIEGTQSTSAADTTQSAGDSSIAVALTSANSEAQKPAVDSPTGQKVPLHPEAFFFTQFADPKWNPNGKPWSEDCGPAALAMAMKRFGKLPDGADPNNPESLINGSRLAMTGNLDNVYTTTDQVVAGAHAVGLKADKVNSIGAVDQALSQGRMVVLAGDPGGYIDDFHWTASDYATDGNGGLYRGGHFILVVGKDGDNYIVNDPACKDGPIELTPAQLTAYFNGPDGAEGVAVGP